MRQLQLLLLAILVCALYGCGGSGQSKVGSLAFKVKWPVQKRLIPYDCASIHVILLNSGGQPLENQVIPRPAQGVLTTTVQYSNLPPGAVTLQASALPNTDGTGVVQAAGSAPATIVANQVASVTVTMADTIVGINILNAAGGAAGGNLGTGQTQQLVWNAYDQAGETVLVSSATITWSITAGSNFGTITPATATAPGGLFTMTASGATSEGVDVQVTENESGKISPITQFTYQARAFDNPGLALLDPSGTHLYATAQGPTGGGVHVFNISSTGQLTFAQEIAAPGVNTLDSSFTNHAAVITPDGKNLYVYALGTTTPFIDEFSIQSDGTLVAGPTIAAVPGAYALTIDPTGKYLYCIGFPSAGRTMNIYTIGSGSLTLSKTVTSMSPAVPTGIDQVPGTSYMLGVAVDSSQTFHMLTMTVNSDGTLNVINDLIEQGAVHAAPYVFSPDGSLAFSFIEFIATDGIAANGVTTNDGYFTAIGSASDADAAASATIGGTPYLFTRFYGDTISNNIYPLGIGSNGPVNAPPDQTNLPVEGFGSVVITPNAKYLYTTNLHDNSISQFATGTGGTLTALSPAKVQG